MQRWSIGAAVAVSALMLRVSAVAASKTYYKPGTRGRAPFISLTVSGGKVTTVHWVLHEDCGETFNGPTRLNTPIKLDGRFNGQVTYAIPGWLGGSSGGTHIWGRLNGSTATVKIDDYSAETQERR